MVEMATFTIKHINRLFISNVSEKVKSDFFRIIIEYSKANGNLVVFYIEPITDRLLDLIEDDDFNVDNFMTYHLSIPIVVPEQSSPLANLLEQGTPLTNNLSEHANRGSGEKNVIFSNGLYDQTKYSDPRIYPNMMSVKFRPKK